MITIPGEAIGKGRPRMTKTGHVYTPSKTKTYEKYVRICYKQQNGEKHDGPVSIEIIVYMAIPKSTSKKQAAEMESGKIRPTKRPDIDNVIKAILDALNGTAYDDDSQIVEISAKRYYSHEPAVCVEISEI